MHHILLTLQYDGSCYSGWVKQQNANTIQNCLEQAIFTVCQKSVYKIGSSKTNKAVHVIDQKVLVQLDFLPLDLTSFFDAVNKALPDDIYISDFKQVDKTFSIKKAQQKHYIYTINFGKYNVFNQNYQLFINYQLDANKLQAIFNFFVGNHDFFSFAKVKLHENITTVRSIDEIKVEQIDQIIKIHFKAQGFIRYQIRKILQTALACYKNEIDENWIIERLTHKYNDVKYCAKSNGLCLIKVTF